MTDDTAELLALCRETFGDDFVAYTTNLPTAGLDPRELVGPRLLSIKHLCNAAAQANSSLSDIERPIHLSYLLGTGSMPFTEHCLVNQLRLQCGGSLPDTTRTDPVLSSLLACLREAWPWLLIPSSARGPIHHGMPWVGLTLRPAARFLAAAMRDTDIRRLFPNYKSDDSEGDINSLINIETSLIWSDGQGGGYLAHQLPDAIIRYAIDLATLGRDLSYASCAKHAEHALDAVRRLARGSSVEVPVVVAISNLSPTHDLAIDKSQLLRTTPSLIERYSSVGMSAPSAYLILHVKVQLAYWAAAPDDQGRVSYLKRQMEDLENFFEGVASTIDRWCYSLLMASDMERVHAPIVEGWTILKPLMPNTYLMNIRDIPTDRTPFPATSMNGDEATIASTWLSQINARHPKHLDIGLRRLLSAVNQRLNPLDGFVDAIMCWENLFGDSNDTVLKVCGSLAWMLEPDNSGRRREFFNELKRLYDTRSKLVHGAKEPTAADAADLRDRAVKIAVRAMRRAYEVPGFMSLTSSIDRWKVMLIGAASPPVNDSKIRS